VVRLLTRTLAAIALILGLVQPATATPSSGIASPETSANETPVEATHQIEVPDATVDVPTGKFLPPEEDSPRARPTVPPEVLAAAKAKTPTGTRPGAGSEVSPNAPPSPQLSFEGLNAGSCCVRPPDTHGAVGLNHFVEITNGTGIGIFNKSNGALLKSVTLNSFFNYTARQIFDPRVVYDRVWNRWVVLAEAFPESSTLQYVFLAVSVTSDPNGAFYKFRFDVPEPAGNFFDYPQLGLDQDAVIVTANIFSSTGPYVNSRAFGIAKAAAYNGKGFSFPYFSLGQSGTVAPPIVEGTNSNAYLVSAFNPTSLRLFRASGLGRSAASIVVQANVPVPSYSIPVNAPQPGTTDQLDTLDARFQNASTQIGNRLLNVHTVGPRLPTPRWYQINTSTNTVASGELGFFFETSDSYDFNPSIVGSPVGGTSGNPVGRMFFTWTSTDVNGADAHQARVKGSGRLAADSTTTFGGSTFGTAPTFYNPSGATDERWGDYSAVTIDPVAAVGCPVGQRAWIVNERHINSTVWGSRFGRLGFC
jgi:hypothetical protein